MDPQEVQTFSTIEPILFWLVAGLTALCAIAVVVTQNIVHAATWLLFTLAGTSALFFLLGADLVGATQLLVYVGGTLVLVVFGVMLTAQGPFITLRTSGAEWAIAIVAGLLLLAVLTTGIVSERHMGPPLHPHIEAVTQYAPPHSRSQRQRPQKSAARSLTPLPTKGPQGAGTDGPEGQVGGAKGQKKDGSGAAKGKAAKGQAGEGDPAVKDVVPLLPPVNGTPPPPEPLDAATSSQATVLGQGFLGLGVGPAHREGKGGVIRTNYLLPFEIVSVHLLVVLIGAAYLARAKRRRGATP